MAAPTEHKDDHAASAPKKNIGGAWADSMRDRFENNMHDREKLVDHRVEDAQAFISKEVGKMKVDNRSPHFEMALRSVS